MLVIDKMRFKRDKIKWRRKNKHNQTYIAHPTDINRIFVGNHTYGPLNVFVAGEKGNLKVGHFCSIAGNVTFILSSDHPTNLISSFPFKVVCLKTQGHEAISRGDIVVDDDVWLGYGATILSGVHIGQGAVVAAGAVVTKDVPPYAIVGGVPARVIKYRFSSELIHELLKVDYGMLDVQRIHEHVDDLYKTLDGAEQILWMPRKENGGSSVE